MKRLILLLVSICFILSVATVAMAAVSADERAALVDLYNSTDGASWTSNTNWLTNDPCDNGWVHVVCNAGKTMVVGIWLDNNNLVGSIPPAIGNLINLKTLELGDNQLSGSIPASIGNITGLNVLNLEINQLSGSIPASIGNISGLQSLFLGDNQLTGSIPVSIGNIPYLNVLSLENNQLTGSIPEEIGNITDIFFVYLENNQLTGSIPDWVVDMTTLTHLRLNNNQLSGSIPAGIGNLTLLTTLDLSLNLLTGSIPPEIGTLASLAYLRIDGNQLTGTIPPEIGNLTSLTSLNLGSNQLTGTIPVGIGNLTGLDYISLNNNNLSGSIPTGIGNLTMLQQLYLNDNNLSGSIPAGIGNLTGLEHLYLSSNQLSGSIPTGIGNLTSLQELRLYSNQLSGSIPAGIGNLTSLTSFNLGSNQLTGSIPPSIGNLTSLQELRLYSNQLSGSLPDSIINLSQLEYLSVNSNKLSGEVPAGITNTVLVGDSSYFSYNALYSTDGGVTSFLDSAQASTTFASTQTQAPTYPAAAVVNDTSIDLSWTADTYAQAGGYEIWYAEVSGGPYTHFANTVDKATVSNTVTGLTPGTDYYFVLRTWTDPHGSNSNKVVSDYSAEATATTTGSTSPALLASAMSGDTAEDGTTATFTLRLSTQPDGDVVVDVTSTVPSEGTVDKSSIAFDTTNWNIANTVTVTGVDDAIADGNIMYALLLAVNATSTTDTTGYKVLDPSEVLVTNLDDDGGGAPPAGGGGGGCFIATAAYGSYMAPDVMVLRQFRDEQMLTNPVGRWLVNKYYAYSPPMADYIAKRPALRAATRIALAPVVGTVKHPGAALVLVGFAFGGGAMAARGRRKRREA